MAVLIIGNIVRLQEPVHHTALGDGEPEEIILRQTGVGHETPPRNTQGIQRMILT